MWRFDEFSSHGQRRRALAWRAITCGGWWCDFAGFCWQSLPKQLEIDRRRCHGVRVMGPECRPAMPWKTKKKKLPDAAFSSSRQLWTEGMVWRLPSTANAVAPVTKGGMTVNNYRRVECSRTKSLYSLIQWEFRCCFTPGDGLSSKRSSD